MQNEIGSLVHKCSFFSVTYVSHSGNCFWVYHIFSFQITPLRFWYIFFAVWYFIVYYFPVLCMRYICCIVNFWNWIDTVVAAHFSRKLIFLFVTSDKQLAENCVGLPYIQIMPLYKMMCKSGRHSSLLIWFQFSGSYCCSSYKHIYS